MESETTLGWILNMKTMFPEELFLSLSTRMNGVRLPLLEVNMRHFFVKLENLRP